MFDETILQRKNISKKNKLKGGLKKTPFLSDQSDWGLEIYLPPKPSTFNLPSSNSDLGSRRKFPRLKPDLYGPPRKTKYWTTEFYQRRTAHPNLLHDPVLSKLYLSTPFTSCPERDLQWAFYAVTHQYMLSADRNVITCCEEFTPNTNKEYQNMKNSLRASAASSAVIPEANILLNTVRSTNGRILWGLAQLQALCRMHYHRKKYRFTVKAIINLQMFFRGHHFRVRYGSTFKGMNKKAVEIQRVVRAFSVRRKKEKMLRSATLLTQLIGVFLAKRRFKKLKRAVTVVTSHVRARFDRFVYLVLVRGMIIKLQARVRGMLKRERVSSLRRERIVCYRAQIFDLWRRASTPLSYRTKFWKLINKNTFLHLALHEEELARLWNFLGITASEFSSCTVFERCLQIQSELDTNKNIESNQLIFLFPAEFPPIKGEAIDKKKEDLMKARTALNAERQKMYSLLKNMDLSTRHRVYQLFNLGETEDRKKERIVKCLWEYRSLIKPSITFVNSMYQEYGNLQNDVGPTKRNGLPSTSVLKRFDLAHVFKRSKETETMNLVKLSTKNRSEFVRSLLMLRLSSDVLETAKACIIALQRKDPGKKSKSMDELLEENRQWISIAAKTPGNSWKEKRYHITHAFLRRRRSWDFGEKDETCNDGRVESQKEF